MKNKVIGIFAVLILCSVLVSASSDKVRIVALSDSYPNNLSINTQTGLVYWNSSGAFNYVDYQTNDLSSYFNLILNGSLCNNNGAIVNGQMCVIPFNFHSDTDGIVTYSGINVNYGIMQVLSNSISPQDKQWFNQSDISFNCSGSSDLPLSSATVYVWNRNSSLFLTANNTLSGNENSTIIDVSLPSGLYYWNCLVTDAGGFGSFSYYNRTLNIDASPPTIDFLSPTPNNNSIFIKNNLTIRMLIKDELTYIKNIYFYFNNILQDLVSYITTQFIPDSYSCIGTFSSTEPCINAFDGNFSSRERFVDGGSGGIRTIVLNYTIPENISGANITFKWGSFAGTTPNFACLGDFKIDYQNYTNNNGWSNLYLCKDYYNFGDPREPNCLSYPNCIINKTITLPFDALLNDNLILNISMDYVGGGGNPLGSFLYEAQVNWINSTIDFNQTDLLDGNYSFYASAYDNFNHSMNTSIQTFTLITPLINIDFNPINNSVISSEGNFICNVSSNLPLTNISFFLWNASNLLSYETRPISGNTSSSMFSYNFTRAGDYLWNCKAWNTYGVYSNYANNSLIVDLTNPIINQESPINNQYLPSTNVSLRCSVQGANLSSLFLYGDFNGTFSRNQTITNISSGNTYTFNLNLNQSDYHWACAINKTDTGALFFGQQGNYSFGIDLIPPIITVNEVSSNSGSQTISVDALSNDAHISSCKYSIYNSNESIDGLNSNVSYSCNNRFSATVTDYGAYTIVLYGKDSAGNEGYSSFTFTVSQYSPVVVSGGSVGGVKPQECNINLIRPTKKIVLSGSNGEISSQIEFIVENSGPLKDTFIFSLSDGLKSHCKIKTDRTDINGKSTFTNWIQCDYTAQYYEGLIEITSSAKKCDSSLSVEVSTSFLGKAVSWFNALLNGEDIIVFGVLVPSIVLFLGLILFMILIAGAILLAKKIFLW